ncbi:conserved Plasmodium protein, unknown function [Plasmodium ovale]|uniref:Uncharacterized protein n=2 Tax=Plasmodium ovale TaxID=36330 RepID=A0A1A8VUM9_PLAOA|nr:conserved Plasmodium protein, unknown function [Plasmodium ovale curtisi]SBS89587.1 conserved Plasmodium protein, unknown function [Plasmodium ovale curtisi]SBT84153.1 conserved Plasmodium protein, unknown function [Plasmodium ovale]
MENNDVWEKTVGVEPIAVEEKTVEKVGEQGDCDMEFDDIARNSGQVEAPVVVNVNLTTPPNNCDNDMSENGGSFMTMYSKRKEKGTNEAGNSQELVHGGSFLSEKGSEGNVSNEDNPSESDNGAGDAMQSFGSSSKAKEDHTVKGDIEASHAYENYVLENTIRKHGNGANNDHGYSHPHEWNPNGGERHKKEDRKMGDDGDGGNEITFEDDHAENAKEGKSHTNNFEQNDFFDNSFANFQKAEKKEEKKKTLIDIYNEMKNYEENFLDIFERAYENIEEIGFIEKKDDEEKKKSIECVNFNSIESISNFLNGGNMPKSDIISLEQCMYKHVNLLTEEQAKLNKKNKLNKNYFSIKNYMDTLPPNPNQKLCNCIYMQELSIFSFVFIRIFVDP